MIVVLYILLGIAFLLNTTFGLGPVLLADGTIIERLFTLVTVALIYAFILFIFLKVRKRFKNKDG